MIRIMLRARKLMPVGSIQVPLIPARMCTTSSSGDDKKITKLKIRSPIVGKTSSSQIPSVIPPPPPSHSHHRYDLGRTEYEDSPYSNVDISAAEKQAMSVTKIGAVANLGLAVSKGTVGFSIASTGLIADAANSLGDLLSDAVVYYSVMEARKQATPDRPWGRGKIEPLGALSVGALLTLTGASIGYTALIAAIDVAAASQLIDPYWAHLFITGDLMQIVLDLANGVIQGSDIQDAAASTTSTAGSIGGDVAASSAAAGSSSAGAGAVGDLAPPARLLPQLDFEKDSISCLAALGISGTSIVAKEALFRYTLKAGKEAHSAAVIANAWQHRADVSTSGAVFFGLIGSMLGFPLLDPLAGLMVAGLIARLGVSTAGDALRDLSDAPASERETQLLRDTCLSVSGVAGIESLQARKSGPYLYVEVTVDVDGNISASAAHRIAELTRLEMLRRHAPRVANAVVDVNPLGSAGLGENSPLWSRDHDYIVGEVRTAALSVEEVISVSEVQLYYKDNGQIASKIDIVLPRSMTIKQAHQIAVITRQRIQKRVPGISEVDVDLELDENDA